ncbi:MAG: SgcJ/EcaC family oxidoreductase [Isosphaeraceae bacterium]
MRPQRLIIGVTLIGASFGLHAQEAPKPGSASERRAIEEVVEAFTRAFNAGDARAAAATFTEDALVVDEDGGQIEGRDAIRERLAESFAENPGAKIEIQTESVRFLGPDTALERGGTTITTAEGVAPERSRFTAIHVKRDGRWLQSVVRDERDAREDEPTPHERLKELEWLTGEWVNESDDAVVHTTCQWTDDGNFLVREFTMKTRGQPVLSGTQRIGWDPTRRQFKTWIFDSEGGFGEGYWTRDGDRWVIKAEGVRQDGQHASATAIITRLGKDRASWQSVDRTLGSVAIPGIDAFIIVRKPPTVGK